MATLARVGTADGDEADIAAYLEETRSTGRNTFRPPAMRRTNGGYDPIGNVSSVSQAFRVQRPPEFYGGPVSAAPGGYSAPRHSMGGYSMPPALHMRYSTPDTQEQADQHTSAMHGRLLELIHQHLARHLVLPDGTKAKCPDAKSVPKYKGTDKLADLERWLTSLVLYLEAALYGGPDMDWQ